MNSTSPQRMFIFLDGLTEIRPEWIRKYQIFSPETLGIMVFNLDLESGLYLGIEHNGIVNGPDGIRIPMASESEFFSYVLHAESNRQVENFLGGIESIRLF